MYSDSRDNTQGRPHKVRLVADIDTSAVTVVAPPPMRVSQHTSETVLGIKRAAFLELARRYRAAGHDVIARGRLRLVEPNGFLAWLAGAGEREESDDDVCEDELAAELGLRVVGGDRLSGLVSVPVAADITGVSAKSIRDLVKRDRIRWGLNDHGFLVVSVGDIAGLLRRAA